MEIKVLGKYDYIRVYWDVLQESVVWNHCKCIIFDLQASLSISISFLNHLKMSWFQGQIELLCWEVNQRFQTIKSIATSLLTSLIFLFLDLIKTFWFKEEDAICFQAFCCHYKYLNKNMNPKANFYFHC